MADIKLFNLDDKIIELSKRIRLIVDNDSEYAD